MNRALTTSHGRVAPCLPGVELRIFRPRQGWDEGQVISTAGWDPLAWTNELLRRDVRTLLCAGIDQFLWGALRGYGIQVVPTVMGVPEDVLRFWDSGRLEVPQSWPPYPGAGVCGRTRRKRNRYRGGR